MWSINLIDSKNSMFCHSHSHLECLSACWPSKRVYGQWQHQVSQRRLMFGPTFVEVTVPICLSSRLANCCKLFMLHFFSLLFFLFILLIANNKIQCLLSSTPMSLSFILSLITFYSLIYTLFFFKKPIF